MHVEKAKKKQALVALKNLGLNERFSVAVLKDALKIHPWDHLAADNFNRLADFAFQRQLDEDKITSSNSQEVFRDDDAEAPFNGDRGGCFEQKAIPFLEKTEKRSFETGTSDFCKKLKEADANIGSKWSSFANESYGSDHKQLAHAKLDLSERLTLNLASGVANHLDALSSGVGNKTGASVPWHDARLQTRSNIEIMSESYDWVDHNEGLSNSVAKVMPESQLPSRERKVTEADKAQEDALAGWNLLRDKRKCYLEQERGTQERLASPFEDISKPALTATSLETDLGKEPGFNAVEGNPAALNLLMENYPGSSDSSESSEATFLKRGKPAFSDEPSNSAGKQAELEGKEFPCARESTHSDLKIEYQGENYSQTFDRQNASCITRHQKPSFASYDIASYEGPADVADGTTLQDTSSFYESDPINGVGVKQQVLSDAVKRKNTWSDLDLELESRHNPVDISRGEENVPISLATGIVGHLSSTFHYAPKSIIYQSAPVTFSLVKIPEDECCSSCSGDCLSTPISCACAKETGGEYAYNAQGCLHDWFLRKAIKSKMRWDEHPRDFYCPSMPTCPVECLKCVRKIESCKGHLFRKFIKECWTKCGCDKKCGNRVVQRGVTRRLQIFWADARGLGVRTLENLPAGAFVCEYVGEILTQEELEGRKGARGEYLKQSFLIPLDAGLCSDRRPENEPLFLDSTYYGNIARFINHRCYDANMLEVPVLIENTDRHYYHVAYFTNRPVQASEELTLDYEIDFDDKHTLQAFQCHCGSRFCRGSDRKHSVFA